MDIMEKKSEHIMDAVKTVLCSELEGEGGKRHYPAHPIEWELTEQLTRLEMRIRDILNLPMHCP